MQKSSLRKVMQAQRKTLAERESSPNLYQHFETQRLAIGNASIVAGFAPIHGEINIWPLLNILHQEGRRIALPVVRGPKHPLIFRTWTPGCEMDTDRYGVSFPATGETLTPKLVFVPLLAFTPRGERLGYGGGYYDRSLAQLRTQSDIFACGVAYAAQEVDRLPTDDHDERLDGILTEDGFRRFT